ncbi:MAG: hypothetical protein MUO61_06410 [Dehalococcoidia bacterium]|nr:hypothetical protein [Dehalococcoidia bacterium]
MGDKAIKGAWESIDLLRDRKYTFRFVSNTTRKCRNSIADSCHPWGLIFPWSIFSHPPSLQLPV